MAYKQGISAPVGSVGVYWRESAFTQNPLDATTIYLSSGNGTQNNFSTNAKRFYVPMNGTINKVYGVFQVAGTLGSAENGTFNIRKNATTSTTISSTVKFNTATVTISTTTLSLSVSAGDFIEFEIIYPTWATNPTNVSFSGGLIVE